MGELAHFCMWVAVYTETTTAAGNSANPTEVPRTHASPGLENPFPGIYPELYALTCKMMCELCYCWVKANDGNNLPIH